MKLDIPVSSSLHFVPLESFHTCNGLFEKTVCKVTYQVGIEDDHKIPFPQLSDSESRKVVCDELLQVSSSQRYADVPVCIQDSTVVGTLVYGNTRSNRMSIRSVATTDNFNDIKKKMEETEIDHYNIQLVRSASDQAVQYFIDTKFPKNTRTVFAKRVDFPGHYRNPPNNWTAELGRDTNYGNLVWRYASSMMLNSVATNNKLFKIHGFAFEEPLEEVDALVIATANTLHLTEQPVSQDVIEAMTKRVMARNHSVPTIVLGVGIQSLFTADDEDIETGKEDNIQATFNNSKLTLPFDFQKKFLNEISHHQSIPAIGVRGDLTATVCRNSGIQNCVSLGCPSLTISRAANLGYALEVKWNEIVRKSIENRPIRIALALPAYGNSNKERLIFFLFAKIIIQNGFDHVTCIAQAPDDGKRFKEFIEDVWNKADVNNKISTDSIIMEEFYNVESWLLAASTKYDLCISARIHGAMPFIASGIPAIILPVDLRIMELIDAMLIPYIMYHKIDTILGLQENAIPLLLNMSSNKNFTRFEINRRTKLKGWNIILQQAGLEMDPALLKILHEDFQSFS